MNTINQIIAQHPQSVALLFQKYGYSALPITDSSLKAMVVKFGQPFVEDLSTLLAASYTGYDSLFGIGKKAKAKRDARNTNASPVLNARVARASTAGIAVQRPGINIAVPEIKPEAVQQHLTNINQQLKANPRNKGLKEKIGNTLNDVFGFLKQGAGIVAVATGKQGAPAADDVYMPPAAANEVAENQSGKKWLVLGAIVIVLLLAFVLFKSPKKIVK
jgi:hypothetical protein